MPSKSGARYTILIPRDSLGPRIYELIFIAQSMCVDWLINEKGMANYINDYLCRI